MSSEHDKDDLRPEYDLSEFMKRGVRGQYVDRYCAGSPSLPASDGDDDVLVEEEADVPFHLTPEMRAELELSIAQADRGDIIPAEQVLAELRARTAQSKLSPPAQPADVIL